MGITLSEIFAQPELWRKVFARIQVLAPEMQRFFAQLPADLDVILTGAGSSAFIGEAVAPLLQAKTGWRVRPVPTTDIVTHPRDFIPSKRPTLLVSYARSGNSPESLAAVELATRVNPGIFHLVVTCSEQGALALRAAGMARTFVVLLPPEANDQGLAMIGSVTGMILTTLLIGDLERISQLGPKIEALVACGSEVLTQAKPLCESLAKLPFERIVFLGSGPLLGIARESHLKVQELSDGQVIGKFDSFLGFRHGPKAVVQDKTFIVYLLSSLAYVRRYETDLVASIRREMTPKGTLAVLPEGSCADADHSLILDPQLSLDDPGYLLPLTLLPAQLLASYKSLELGLNPDSPSARGAIQRVVKGVTIYPFTDAN